MKTVVLKIDKFNEGMSDDVRDQLNGVFTLTRNFDIFSNRKRMTPYRDTNQANTITSTSSLMTELIAKNFLYAAGDSTFYALSNRSSGQPGFFRLLKNTSPIDSNFALASTASQTSIGVAHKSVFVEYKDYLWGLKGSGAATAGKLDVWRWGALSTGAKALTENYGGADVVTGSAPTANGIIGDDDNLYLPTKNTLVRVNAALAVTDAVLTIPSNFTITSLDKWGRYLAIGCKPDNSNAESKTFFWDYVSDDVFDSIAMGRGNLQVIGNIDGSIIGILDVGTNSSFAINRKIQILEWNGGSVRVIKEIPYNSIALSVYTYKQKIGNKLYFIISDTVTYGVWVIGRKLSTDPLAVTFDRYLSNDTPVTDAVNAFYFIGDFLFASVGTAGNFRRTNEQASGAFTSTSMYKSQKFNAGDLSKVKQLKSVALTTVPIPSGGTVKLDYRIDATSTSDLISTWTQIFSKTTQGAYYHEAATVESAAREFSDGHEFEFRVRSTGFVEPIDLKPVFEVIDDQIEE